MYKCKVLDLLDNNVLNSKQSVLKLHSMVRGNSKASNTIWSLEKPNIVGYRKNCFYWYVGCCQSK